VSRLSTYSAHLARSAVCPKGGTRPSRFPFCLLLLLSATVLPAQSAIPSFSAAVSVSRETYSLVQPHAAEVSETRAKLYFDGNQRWRFDSIQVRDGWWWFVTSSRQRVSQPVFSPWSIPGNTEFFLRDAGEQRLLKFLLPPTASVFYHEYDMRLDSLSMPEAYGLDSWAIYDRANPCSTAPTMTCERIAAETLEGRACEKWVLKRTAQVERTDITRTLWIDHESGIVLRTELVEEQADAKNRKIRRHRVRLQLFDVSVKPQNSRLFQLVSSSGRHIGTTAARDPHTFRTQAQEVLIDALVHGKRGRSISNLDRTDFRVFDDGAERPIVHFSQDELPLSVALVVDHSPSMTGEIQEMKETATEVLSRLKPQDNVALFAFDINVEKLVDLTSDRKRITDALRPIDVGKGTDVLKALFAAVRYLKQAAPEMRRVIIVMSDNFAGTFTTDGNGIRRDQQELIDTALESEIVIYSLRIPTIPPIGWPLIDMGRVTEQTGGEIITGPGASKMLEQTVLGLRQRYTLSFRPGRRDPDGRLHTIGLRLIDKYGVPAHDYSIQYRRGYRMLQPVEGVPPGLDVGGVSKR
jgi:Ca-activated chloride channel family protein